MITLRGLCYAFFFVLFLAHPAGADPSLPSLRCLGSSQIVNTLQSINPNMHLTMLHGHDAAGFLTVYNARPPLTHWIADEILIVKNPRLPHIAELGFFKDGRLIVHVVLKAEALDYFVNDLGQEI